MRRRGLGRLALALVVAAAAPLTGCLSNDAPFQSSSAPRRPSASAVAAPAAPAAAPAVPAPAPKAPRKPRAAPAPAPAPTPAPAPARAEPVNHPPAKDVPKYSYSHPQLQATPAPASPASAASAPADPMPPASTPTPAPAAPAPAPSAPAASETKDTCGVSALADLVGKPRTELPIAQDLSRRRVVCEGCPMTDDVRPDRQTITYSLGTGKVTKVACG